MSPGHTPHAHRISARAMQGAGAIVACIGIAHLLLPTWGYDPAQIASMSPRAHAHFLDLGTYAIASFLLAFGALSIAYSRAPARLEARLFCRVMTVVWIARLALELRYPVDLSLFSVANPHPPLVAVLIGIVGLYTAAAIGTASTRAR